MCVHVQGDIQLCLLSDIVPGVLPTRKYYIRIGQILEGYFLMLYVPCMMQN
jgi:hypothetical protein